jgi:hypothetical protein
MVTCRGENYWNLKMKRRPIMLRELMLDYEPIEKQKYHLFSKENQISALV